LKHYEKDWREIKHKRMICPRQQMSDDNRRRGWRRKNQSQSKSKKSREH
jgi:hypothetical protein